MADFKGKNLLLVGAGLVLGAIGAKAVKTNKAKNLSVDVVSKGLKAKESLDGTVENVKESFDDVLAEARLNNRLDEELKRKQKEKEEEEKSKDEKELLALLEEDSNEESKDSDQDAKSEEG